MCACIQRRRSPSVMCVNSTPTVLWPALGVVFPSSGAGGRLGLVDSRLRNADGLLRGGSDSRSQRWLGAVFSTDIFIVGQKRSGYPQSLDFFFQSGHFQFL